MESREFDATTGAPTPNLPADIVIRAFEPTDTGFILNSWLLSYKDSNRDTRSADYFEGQQNLIVALAASNSVAVACDAETPGFILGWACGSLINDPGAPERLRVHYVFVKQHYRQLGVGRQLLEALGWQPGMEIEATHWTYKARLLASKFHATHNKYPLTIGNQPK